MDRRAVRWAKWIRVDVDIVLWVGEGVAHVGTLEDTGVPEDSDGRDEPPIVGTEHGVTVAG